MECIKCGSHTNLEMYPLRWEPDKDAVGFVFVCSECISEGKLDIKWSLEDGNDKGEDQETH